MADKRISQLVERTDIANNDVLPIVASGATTTNKVTISTIQDWMQDNLDVGVTSVGITLGTTGTDINVTGSPVTSSGNITINLPTASATNRGALSSADWSTFNSKQGAITLTTTGTSGVSTLVGNTLNIPNYSTDLSGYVTLGTVQTITAQKTFTTSGSSDTMIISHGSGSGFALDVIKAGSGEAIRVQKTSGSGNAMTISGGNFEAPTIVKTGGTSSQFLKADGSVDSNTYLTTASASAAYVPYTGANSNVNLGQFDLSASTIRVDGSGPTFGSYLGFKHSTSVTSGADGYTSMYTFGTNTIAFKSVSGATTKDFSFSMIGITAGVPGGRQYTLPDASGTLALTSDLTGYVTLGTAQTITAQKTFSTSGSSDTAIINHGSGSGIALNITKAGNGEGLRVSKTSGSGNAVTITGGALSAEAGQFSGDLQTSTRISATSGSNAITITPNVGGTQNRIETTGSLPLSLVSAASITMAAGGTTPQITLATTGAVTLTGALNGTSASFTGTVLTPFISVSGSAGNIGNINSTNANGGYITWQTSGTTIADLGSAQQIFGSGGSDTFGINARGARSLIFGTNDTARLTISSTGAATFSSSVNIASTTTIGGVDGSFLRTYSATNDALRWAFINSSTGIFSIQQQGDGYANQGDRLVINRSGNVGIGTASPEARLDIKDASAGGAIGMFIENTASSTLNNSADIYFGTWGGSSIAGVTNARIQALNVNAGNAATDLLFHTYSGSASAERMRITSVGNTQPGADNAYSLGVSGTRWSAVWAANGTIQTSDEREKKDIVDSDLGLDLITKLRPVSFKWKVGQNVVTSQVVKDEEGNPILDEEGNEKTESVLIPREGKRTHYGLIAQEVEEVLDGKDFGGFIHDEETDTKGLRYDQFVPLLIKSIQELNDKIAILESKLK